MTTIPTLCPMATAMTQEIRITKKPARRGDDGYKVVSVRMKEEMLERLDVLSGKTNRSRNELINLLLESALDIVKVDD
ncbi:ribbon-helix-helix protein, CopG family [Acutalibacter sp. 1XD8-33]|uniref:ribbon-helix-helix protein, CopG family n=1 Tax=Acutalibacter sp. 1XD8-33 TaxID=2320081 RepID=UPI001FAA972C|nr:ribbon-helix-helix protein, CopG family [Acutalibacter sp. 1XD8-33]